MTSPLTLDEARRVLAALIDSQRATPSDSMLWVQQMDAIRTLEAKLEPDLGEGEDLP